jgi:MFS family permease
VTIEEKRSKEPKMSKKAIYIRAAIFIVLMLIAGFFLFLSFLGGIVGPLLTGNVTLFVGGVIFFILFLAVGIVARRFEWAWEALQDIKGIQKKTTREALKDSLPFIGSTLGTLVFAIVIEIYFQSFPSSISVTLGKEILNSILTMNGILLGFSGVVIAQFLWAIHSKGNMLYEQIITCRNEASLVRELKKEFRRLHSARASMIITSLISVIPYLASIMLCINRLTMIDENATISPRILLSDPIIYMAFGVFLLAFTMLQNNLLPDVREIAGNVGNESAAR